MIVRAAQAARFHFGESMNRMKILALSVAMIGALHAPAHAQRATTAAKTDAAPEIATGYADKVGKSSQKFMVAAANPLATQAGYQVLKQGGAAIDAAIAVQLVLTLVEPQSSGIGGGSFMVYADGKHVQSYDGRETAPAAADEHLFQDKDGKPLSREAGIVGEIGRAHV